MQGFFHISLENAPPCPWKSCSLILNTYKFFVGKCIWQEKVRPTHCLGSIFRSNVHLPNLALVTVTEYLPYDFSRTRLRLYIPWKSHCANIGKHLKIFTTVFVVIWLLGNKIINIKWKKEKVDKDKNSEKHLPTCSQFEITVIQGGLEEELSGIKWLKKELKLLIQDWYSLTAIPSPHQSNSGFLFTCFMWGSRCVFKRTAK